MIELQPGTKAPDFSLPALDGDTVSLAQFADRKVVLFFYPKDNTQGCTLEARDFTRLKDEFEKEGAVVIGMSPDSVKKHQSFAKKHELTVMLAADEDMAILSAYGVWQEKSMYGRKYMGVVRTTFLIGEDGMILNIWPKVKVQGHAEEVLEALRAANA